MSSPVSSAMSSLKSSVSNAAVGSSSTVLFLAAIEVVLISVTCYLFSTLVGTSDSANDLSKTVIPVVCTLGVIVFIHTVMWYLYYTHNSTAMTPYFLFASAMNFLISLTALSVAVVNRS